MSYPRIKIRIGWLVFDSIYVCGFFLLLLSFHNSNRVKLSPVQIGSLWTCFSMWLGMGPYGHISNQAVVEVRDSSEMLLQRTAIGSFRYMEWASETKNESASEETSAFTLIHPFTLCVWFTHIKIFYMYFINSLCFPPSPSSFPSLSLYSNTFDY